MAEFEIVTIEGEAYERGRQYGARAFDSIGQNVEIYQQLIEFHGGRPPAAARQAAAEYQPTVAAHAPELLEEMRGIADGAGVDLTDVLLINARSELMGAFGEGACTALAATPQVTAGGVVLMGQNWDWYTAVAPEPLLLLVRPVDGPQILTLVEAGQVGKIGLNSAGLGVGLNFLSHAHRGQGVPVHVILRQMLGCAHLGEAVHQAYGVPRATAANVLLAHAEGEVLDLELTAADVDFLYADEGWLVHANHFESPRLRAGDTGLATSLSSLPRAARGRRLLAAARGQISVDTLQAILADHAYGAYAICRHEAPGEAELQRTATRASIILDLAARTMHVAAGQPCRAVYRALSPFAPG
ncbi:MAG: C45 family autoproteolytic acyltransferase/hydrolase [Anaerolineae bacterium]|jgi:isopenicillin-N N-acyltransferase-like protein